MKKLNPLIIPKPILIHEIKYICESKDTEDSICEGVDYVKEQCEECKCYWDELRKKLINALLPNNEEDYGGLI